MAKTSKNGCCAVFRIIGGFCRRILPKRKSNKVCPQNYVDDGFPPEQTQNILVPSEETKDQLCTDVQEELGLDEFIEDYVIIELERIRSMFLVNGDSIEEHE